MSRGDRIRPSTEHFEKICVLCSCHCDSPEVRDRRQQEQVLREHINVPMLKQDGLDKHTIYLHIVTYLGWLAS